MHQKNFPSSSFLYARFNIQLQYGKKNKKTCWVWSVIKRITGSVDAACWLNGFGHSISYDEVNALQTKLAESKSNTSLVPTRIQSGVFVTSCLNNYDRNMESIYSATLHGINSIIIQQLNTQQVEATGNNSAILSIERRRSFKPIYHELQSYIKEKGRKNQSNTNQTSRHQHQPIGWDAFQTRR